jgi:hypothetical protein
MLDEIENVENIVNILAFTVERMRVIDGAYRAAFPLRAAVLAASGSAG